MSIIDTCQIKDQLDQFFSQAVDQYYIQVGNYKIRKKNKWTDEINQMKDDSSQTDSNSTDNESENSNSCNSIHSVFKLNCFESQSRGLKIKDLLNVDWKGIIMREKKKQVQLVLGSRMNNSTNDVRNFERKAHFNGSVPQGHAASALFNFGHN